jgi:hypothetical protein
MDAASSPRPLGVLPAVALSPAQARTLTVLETFDLAPVGQRLVQDGVFPERMLDEALFEFRRFLGLRAFVPGPIIMFSDHIDQVWHTCIIFTRLYAALCQQAFGEFIHHEPTMDHDPGRDSKIAAARALYERIYGPMGPTWGTGHRPRCA